MVLQKAQNRILKILFKLERTTSTSLLHKSNQVLKITDLSKLRTLLISHKVIHHPSKTNISHTDIERVNRDNRNLRNNMNMRITTESFLRNNKISENAAVLWNDIPQDLKLIHRRDTFKNKMKDSYLTNYI